MRRMVFGGLVIVVYIALAYARKFSAGCGGACPPSGFEFAFVVFLQVLAAALIVSLGAKLCQELGYGACDPLDVVSSDNVATSPTRAQGTLVAGSRRDLISETSAVRS
jgi:hypothetical protein